ncbi:F-box only protein 7-like [Stegodyphus dumicola]|uniref:F-box only protein 7-like n=1 Tax=Stegodyphus dumicola TaxID=202533 RepID=UPI0015ABA543|nr:F-box only protein 7-like [Stegodyphus dumicola]
MNHLPEEYVIHEECTFPKDFCQLYNSANVENVSDALTVLLHAFMLEVNFVPKCNDDYVSSNSMPENWKTSGVFKIKYSHKTCPDVSCWMTCVPLYSTLVVHGAIDNTKDYGSTSTELQIGSYIQGKNDIDFTKPFDLFQNIKKLSRHFKDEFCFPLLALLHESNYLHLLFFQYLYIILLSNQIT